MRRYSSFPPCPSSGDFLSNVLSKAVYCLVAAESRLHNAFTPGLTSSAIMNDVISPARHERSSFLKLPQEIRLLIYALCQTDRWLLATENAHNELLFGYGNSGCRKLQQINHQIRNELATTQRPGLSLHFARRVSFCKFLNGNWLSCSDSGRRYRGGGPGLKVSEAAIRKIEAVKLAPGTAEVGYLNLSNLTKWLPKLKTIELDLSHEAMWAYHQDSSFPLRDVLIRDLNWRLGTIFGVDASSLRQYGDWTLVVHATFMLPANFKGCLSVAEIDGNGRLKVVSCVDPRYLIFINECRFTPLAALNRS
jgi:hypothetical protein